MRVQRTYTFCPVIAALESGWRYFSASSTCFLSNALTLIAKAHKFHVAGIYNGDKGPILSPQC